MSDKMLDIIGVIGGISAMVFASAMFTDIEQTIRLITNN